MNRAEGRRLMKLKTLPTRSASFEFELSGSHTVV